MYRKLIACAFPALPLFAKLFRFQAIKSSTKHSFRTLKWNSKGLFGTFTHNKLPLSVQFQTMRKVQT